MFPTKQTHGTDWDQIQRNNTKTDLRSNGRRHNETCNLGDIGNDKKTIRGCYKTKILNGRPTCLPARGTPKKKKRQMERESSQTKIDRPNVLGPHQTTAVSQNWEKEEKLNGVKPQNTLFMPDQHKKTGNKIQPYL